MNETHQVSVEFYPTTNTYFAAALTTVGVPFCREKGIDPVTNIYDQKRPYKTGANGTPLPGEVTYYLATKSDTCPRTTGVLADAFLTPRADAELDAALKGLLSSATDPEVKKQVQDIIGLLPLAIMAYARGIADNRNRIADEWKNAVPHLRFPRGAFGSRLISKRKYDSMNPREKAEFLNR